MKTENKKNKNRYSYTRFKTYQTCPKKHHYAYIEGLLQTDSEPLSLGKFFHTLIERTYNKEPYDDVIKEYRHMVGSGKIRRDADLLEYVLDLYVNYWYDEDLNETILGIELEVEDPINDTEHVIAKIDKIVQKRDSQLIFMRDTKTTSGPLRYTTKDVYNNQQLLFYTPFAEKKINANIDVIEIDEVRLAKLQPVPINKNGKPSGSPNQLGLVTYDDYYNELCAQGLEDAPEYRNALEYLEKRGHPLFKRERHQIIDKVIVESNMLDMQDIYKSIQGAHEFRIPGWQCSFCPYNQICELDKFFPSQEDREILIGSIKPEDTDES